MLPLIGAGIGLIGTVGKMIGRGKANREMDQLLKQNPTYQKNPIAGERLELAKQLMNARMPSAASLEKNIMANQANQMANVNRVATDSSQALAMAAGLQGGTNNAFQNLSIQENQDQQRRLNNLEQAQEGMINEDDKVYQDQLRRFDVLASIRGAQRENKQNNWGDIAGLGFSAMNFGLQGGMNGLLGGLGKGGQQTGGGEYQGLTVGRGGALPNYRPE